MNANDMKTHRQRNTQQQKLRFSTDSAPTLNVLTVMSEHLVTKNVNFMGKRYNSMQFSVYLLMCRLTSTWAYCKDRKKKKKKKKQKNSANKQKRNTEQGKNI
jgi:L-asparagine transporter-like permease